MTFSPNTEQTVNPTTYYKFQMAYPNVFYHLTNMLPVDDAEIGQGPPSNWIFFVFLVAAVIVT